MTNYESIINLPHHVSRTRKPMDMMSRAAQFAPFAAPTGHDAAIQETARQTTEQLDQSAEQLEEMSRKLNYALSLSDAPLLTITYFQPDSRKSGGAYVTIEGKVKSIDEYSNLMILADDNRIPLSAILSIDSPCFDSVDQY